MAVMGAAAGAINRSRTRFLDLYMVIVTVALVIFGLLAIYSADGGGPLTGGNDSVRQFVFFVVGLGLMTVCARMDYRIFARLAWVIYGINLVMVLLVLRVGETVGGATRWFKFGPITYQPSEGAKLAIALALAAFVAGRGERMRYSYNFLISLAIVGVPAALVYRQPRPRHRPRVRGDLARHHALLENAPVVLPAAHCRSGADLGVRVGTHPRLPAWPP